MKRLYLFLGLIIFSLAGKAQQNYFIYLQTDNNQPFYVKIKEEIYSSSKTGYAIIPRLHKGDYILNIGFPKNEWPEQKISVNIEDDAGYALKDFKEKGWGLFNLQSLAVSMANKDENNETFVTDANEFAGTLANVVNTPSLNERKVIPKKVVETPAPPKVEQVVAQKTPVAEEQKLQEELVVAEVLKTDNAEIIPAKPAFTNSVNIISKASDADGIAMVFVSNSLGGTDTIRIFIADEAPNRISEVLDFAIGEPVKNPEVVRTDEKSVSKTTNQTNDDKRFLNIELPNPNSSEATIINKEYVAPENIETEKVNDNKVSASKKNSKTAPAETNEKRLTFNSDCKAIASDDDFLKTRKKMAAETNAADMIAAAKKRFKTACYSTEQIKNLSVLFLKDETRYNFFDAAYPFVHDTQNFPDLISALTDEYYTTRFKAMLR